MYHSYDIGNHCKYNTPIPDKSEDIVSWAVFADGKLIAPATGEPDNVTLKDDVVTLLGSGFELKVTFIWLGACP